VSTRSLAGLGEWADQWASGDVAVCAEVLCRLNVGNQCDKPPCPRHLSTAHYMLAALARAITDADHERPMASVFGDHYDVKQEVFQGFVQNLGDRTWWQIKRRQHNEPRLSWWQYKWGRFRRNDWGRRVQADPSEAQLVSSLCTDGTHMPTLDIDFGASLVPSTTAGHYHLYLNKRLTWRRYRRFLRACKRAGLIEPGYYRSSVRRRATYLWRPGLQKRNEEAS
jgi:hypothetical protein